MVPQDLSQASFSSVLCLELGLGPNVTLATLHELAFFQRLADLRLDMFDGQHSGLEPLAFLSR